MSATNARFAVKTPRFDFYRPIHKALRAFMSDTLVAVGRMDPEDDHDVTVALEQARSLLSVLASHLEHENQFVHAAMEARRPGSTARTAHEHVEHECALGEIESLIDRVAQATGAERAAIGLQLYRRLALFVAENLEHMSIEESDNLAVLWADYTDEELMAIERAIVAHVPPPTMATIARWMMAGLAHAERVVLLQGMRQGAPAEVFEGVLAIARANLGARDWAKLASALALPNARAA
jgi:Hemerythrin HHE cation binding domain